MSTRARSPRSAALTAVCLLAVGCASAPTEGTRTDRTRIEAGNNTYDVELTRDRINTHHVVDAAIDAVWAALPEVFAALGLEGGVLDRAGRQFGLAKYQLAPRRIAHRRLSDLFSCGSSSTGPKADSYEVRYILVTYLTAEDRGTDVSTRLEAVARPRSVSVPPINCASTGVLEQTLVDSLTTRVTGTHPGTE